MKKIYPLCLMLILSITTTGCATTTDQPRTTSEKIASCAGMMIAGALVGYLAKKDTKAAGAGAAAGGVACAVWIALNNKKDQERIAAMQAEAARTGETQTETWTGDDDKTREVTVAASTHTEISVNTPQGAQPCRRLNTTATVDDQSDQAGELWCRNSDGSWSASDIKPA